MNIEPIAYFISPLESKFGVPRQSGLAENLPGEIVMEPAFRNCDYLRGIEEWDYLWIIWGFSANQHAATSPLVRPPVLGGNEKRGVFATRSPFRPNAIGLSAVKIDNIEWDTDRGPIIHVLGADLMNTTPIYDIKPYLPFADAHPEARGGFASAHAGERLRVVISDKSRALHTDNELDQLSEILAHDPRPRYIDNPERIYGMPFKGSDVHFKVANGIAYLLD